MSEVRVALVTGASRGIGRALAVELARVGVEVYGTGRDEAALTETARLCEPHGVFHARALEVRSEADVARVVDEAPRLDLCVNNAAVLHMAPFVETPVDQVEEMLDVNVTGAFLVMREAARRMLRDGGGRIVDIASDAATGPLPGAAAYSSSKHGLAGLSKTLAEELRPGGVQVTTVYPGATDTDIHGLDDPRDGYMAPAEVARAIVAVVLAVGTTVRVAELHLQPAAAVE